MAVFLFFIVSCFFRFRRCQEDWSRSLAEELFVAGILCLLPNPICKPLIGLFLTFAVIDAFLFRHFSLRMRPEFYSHFLQPSIYWSSARGYFKQVPASFALLSLSLTILVLMPRETFLPGAALLCFGWMRTPKDHFLLLTMKDLFFHPRKRALDKLPKFQEKALYLSKEYPLLRSTREFLGEKQFDLQLDPKERPHVIFCFLESFRAKSLHLAPNFQALCKKGIHFTEFYANSNSTSWATISSLFGVPSSMQRSYLHAYTDLPMIGLPQIFKEGAGYKSAVIQGSHLMLQGTAAFYQAHGFDTILGKKEILETEPDAATLSWGVHDEAMFSYSVDWLAKQKESVFLNLFTITNHHPWVTPDGWEPPEAVKGNPYLETYAYTDYALGKWMKRLEETGLAERSIIFFLGDHGQGLGEHDAHYAVRRTLYEEDIQIPLLIYAPGRIEQPKTISAPCSQIDLLPTVLDLFQLKTPHHSLGSSLLRKKKHFVFSSYPFDGGTIACRLGRWKAMIRENKMRLFDLREDPAESQDVSAAYPRRASRLKKIVEEYSATLQELYRRRAFTPSGQPSHFAPKKEINDQQLASELKKRGALFSLDLSGCSRVTGKGIIAPGLSSLNMSGSLRVDAAQIASQCPGLRSLDLSHCRLLTDACLTSILQACTGLEELLLEGVDDLQSIVGEPLRDLRLINLLKCPTLDGTWAPWISSLPALKELRLSCSGWSDAEFCRLRGDAWHFLHLSDCSKISSQSIVSLLEQNRGLGGLIIEESSITGEELFEALQGKPLRYLGLRHCPNVKNDASFIKEFPLEDGLDNIQF